jgi:GT2 family glycosyltransferase
MREVGIVIIGRNEGQRLRQCLESVRSYICPVVYVDSGSTDGSVEMARNLGAEVVMLPSDAPFTAALARNAGLDRLIVLSPQIQFVQFLDGDTEMQSDWLERAAKTLKQQPSTAIVCGRRRERHAQQSIYNTLADLEWDTPIGEASECGGDAMMRIEPLREVRGFDPSLIAGEEPDLCVRLRQRGWKVMRLDAEMTLHDAAMIRFDQWWKRNVRNGYAFAEGAARHGGSSLKHWVKQSRSNWIWGGIVPLLIILLALFTRGWGLMLLLVYPLMMARIFLKSRRRNWPARQSRIYAIFCMLSKFPQMQGQLLYAWRSLHQSAPHLIEYKTAESVTQ